MHNVNKRWRRKKVRRLIYSNWSVLLLIIVTVFLGYQVTGLHKKWSVSELRRTTAGVELRYYTDEEQSLRERIEQIQTPEGREKAIRQRFNVVKPGERVIYVVEEDNTFGSDIVLDKEVVDEKGGFFDFLREFFRL